MLNKNEDLKAFARKKRVPFWAIAQELNISEMTFTRWLRVELTPERRAQIMNAIEAIARRENEERS